MKLTLLHETVKYVSRLNPFWHLGKHPLFIQALFELKYIVYDIKIYINIKKENNDMIVNDGVDKYSNVIPQKNRYIWIILQLLKFHHS